MTGLADLATGLIAAAQKRVDATSINVSNINTPGFRSRRIFQHVLEGRQPLPSVATMRPPASEAAALRLTGNPLDFAVTGGGYMMVRSGDRLAPIVSGQFRRDADGKLVDGAGGVLQAAGGGDIVLSADRPALLADGTLLVGGQAEARVGTFLAADGEPDGNGTAALAAAPGEAGAAVLRQGAVIPSDVDLGTEMVELTRASRMAETGARLFQIYDDLSGRVASKLGELGR